MSVLIYIGLSLVRPEKNSWCRRLTAVTARSRSRRLRALKLRNGALRSSTVAQGSPRTLCADQSPWCARHKQ